MKKCKNCDRAITGGDENSNAQWIHEHGFYQCSQGSGTFAELKLEDE